MNYATKALLGEAVDDLEELMDKIETVNDNNAIIFDLVSKAQFKLQQAVKINKGDDNG